MSGSVSPLWMAHHWPEQYERCVMLGRFHVCRRCLVLYPVALTVAVVWSTGAAGVVGRWCMWSAPGVAVIEWALEQCGATRHRPRRQTAATVIAAVGLGVALGEHFGHPFAWRATAPMLTWSVVAIVVWTIAGRRGTTGSEGWEVEFECAERERERSLRATLGLDVVEADAVHAAAVTKSMSCSTEPTSEECRSR
ncbi:MAG: hypothetical protein R2698_05475 [Microthrixaceae bacterium]